MCGEEVNPEVPGRYRGGGYYMIADHNRINTGFRRSARTAVVNKPKYITLDEHFT